MMESISRKIETKKEAHKAMCQNSTEDNKRMYKSMKNKAVLKAMREKAEEAFTELQNCPNWMLRLVKGLKTDSKEVKGGRCIRGSDGKLCFSENDVWKDYIECVVNEKNDWDLNVEGNAVEGPVVCVSREEELQALNEMKAGKAPGHSEVSLELIAASGGVGIQVMIVVPIFKGKGDIRNNSCYRAVRLLEHGMKLMKRMLEERLCMMFF